MIVDKFGEPVTEPRWHKVELCIKEFIKRYPEHWKIFKQDLAENRTEYQEALNPEGKKASWRNTAAFPVVYRKATLEDEGTLTGKEDDNLVEVASLVEPLKMLLPGLLDPDEPGKPNKLYKAFLKRFPVFQPGEKS